MIIEKGVDNTHFFKLQIAELQKAIAKLLKKLRENTNNQSTGFPVGNPGAF